MKQKKRGKTCNLPFGPQRPLSWSAISSFNHNKEEWYRRYILNEKLQTTPAMEFGTKIGTFLAEIPEFMPEVPRYPVFEHRLTAKIDNIFLIGYLDSFDPKTKNFIEYKTSSNKTRWTQKTAQEHGQILMYLFLLWKNYGVPPEEIKCSLVYVPVTEGGDFQLKVSDEPVKIFKVRHTSADVLKFAAYIREVYREMEQYVDNYTCAK
jgi:hypothetical protein